MFIGNLQREGLGFCPLGDEVDEGLVFYSLPRLVCDVEDEELDSPLGDPSCGIPVTIDIC